MPTYKKSFTGSGTTGFIKTYKDRHGNPLVSAPGGVLIHPKTNLKKNIFEGIDSDIITVKFLTETKNGFYIKKQDVEIGTKLKELEYYNPEKRHYILLNEDIRILITKEQVLTGDISIVVNT